MKNFIFLKEAEKENALASEHKSCQPEKINMRVTTSQYEIYLILASKIHICSVKTFSSKALSTRQRKQLFWHELKVMCCLPIPFFYTGEVTITVGRCTELELFA